MTVPTLPLPRLLLFPLTLVLAANVALAVVPTEMAGGPVVLPVTGLAVDLPALRDSCVYHVSGSWALDASGNYDGRDIVDQLCEGTLTAGTWISLGYFSAGEGSSLVNAVAMTDDWTTEADLWGGHWSIHGGTYDLGELGATPAVVLSTSLGRGMSALIHHYFVGTPAPQAQADLLARLAESAVPATLWDAASAGRWQPVMPTHRDDVRNRGDIDAVRTVALSRTGMTVDLPDDGAVWIARNDPEADADYLDRMAPSLPDVSLEIAYADGIDGPTLFATLELATVEQAARNLPAGWTAGPGVQMDDGRVELTATYETVGGVLVVGVFQAPGDTDVGYLWPVLRAIAEGGLRAEAAAAAGDEGTGE